MGHLGAGSRVIMGERRRPEAGAKRVPEPTRVKAVPKAPPVHSQGHNWRARGSVHRTVWDGSTQSGLQFLRAHRVGQPGSPVQDDGESIAVGRRNEGSGPLRMDQGHVARPRAGRMSEDEPGGPVRQTPWRGAEFFQIGGVSRNTQAAISRAAWGRVLGGDAGIGPVDGNDLAG